MGFEFGSSVGMMLGAPVGYPLEYSIGMFLGLSLINYYGTWEGYLVGFLPDTLGGLMIGT